MVVIAVEVAEIIESIVIIIDFTIIIVFISLNKIITEIVAAT